MAPHTLHYLPNQQSDLGQILQEAQYRWLRPVEICEILRHYQSFQLTPDPPVRPPAGSLYLFDRKVFRYFCKDGHRWRKKKDGKTIKEAHEKLKAGSVDALHCYYAHGEDSKNFQRRSYWMLDKQLENIVLVHYRKVREPYNTWQGYKQGVSRLLSAADPGSQLGSPQTNTTNYLEESNSASLKGQASYTSNPDAVGRNEPRISSELEGAESGVNPWALSLVNSTCGSVADNSSSCGDKFSGLLELSMDHPYSGFLWETYSIGSSSSIWTHGDSSGRQSKIILDPKFFFGQPSAADFLSHELIDARLDVDTNLIDVGNSRDELLIDAPKVFEAVGALSAVAKNSNRAGRLQNDEAGEIKKLDSFGKWMDSENGGDCDDSLMASISGNYLYRLDAANDGKDVSGSSHHMQLDTDSLGPSLSHVQLFSIHDFAPECAYSGTETKVLITGSFLGDKSLSSCRKWGCMFGEIEVSAEVLSETVLRCQVPSQAPGRVPFYVTCSNRLACSEVREFEYRENPSQVAPSVATTSAADEEVHLLVRFAKMLFTALDRKWLDCSAVECDKCKVKREICSLKGDYEYSWDSFTDLLGFTEDGQTRDFLVETILKDKLYEWIVCKTHEEGKGPNILDDEGLGAIHLAAALGYEWSLAPIVAAGVSINFRDARGRSALHWAAHYGREEVVVALVRLGAAAGAVDDPTAAFPGGQTAADLASRRGYKGIAGYLAEAHLTSHLCLLMINTNVMNTVAATVAAEKALETVAQEVVPLNTVVDEEVALKGSLAAVRRSAHAAALIQASFRAHSFHERQLSKSSNDGPETSSDLVTLGYMNKVQNISHFEDYLHSAALRIQQKYRGWKGRKEFFKIRNRIVKIQAHVRGHQVRNNYKKVVWSAGIVEKAILRWRRRKPGLRGFRTDTACANRIADQDNEYEFLRTGRKQKFEGVQKALARVQSMVRHPQARYQYTRLVEKFDNFKLNTAEGST